MKQTITTATEKRIDEMIKNEKQYALELFYLLNFMKSNDGCLGSTVKQMKKWNIEMPNKQDVTIYDNPKFTGMSIDYNKYINVVLCKDLHYASIKDFNGLVKKIYEIN